MIFFNPMTAHNDTQPHTRQLPGMSVGESRRPVLAEWDLVKKCRNRLDAVRLCVQLSGMSNESVAASLEIDKGNFSRMMQGRTNFPDAKSVTLMELCGNYAPMQYEAWACGFELLDKALLQGIARAA